MWPFKRRAAERITMSGKVKPLHTGFSAPLPASMPLDGKLTITLNVDVLALELSRDREGTIDAVIQRTSTFLRSQLAVVEIE